MPQIQYNMNGWRHQLSDQLTQLRDMAEAIINDDWFDKDELKEVVGELICLSNSVNCVSFPGDSTFSDMSDVEVAHLGEVAKENC